MNNSYIAVSSKRPCLKCGKTSICFYTKNDQISICSRSSDDPDFEIEGSRWRVFTHVESWKTLMPKNLKNALQKPPQLLKKASIQIRDIAYRTILELSPASEIPELVEFLKNRGITNTEDYGAMPLRRKFRRKIAYQVWLRLKEQFPEFEDIWEMASIPGFWIKDNHCEFWYRGDFSFASLLIPYRNPQGKIKGMQIRSFNSNYLSNSSRYHWLSVPRLISRSANVTLHFAGWRENVYEKNNEIETNEKSNPLLITEGALKADTVQFLQGANGILGRIVSPVGNSGISAAHAEIVNYCRNKEVWLAFDQDFQTNKTVMRVVKKLLLLFERSKEPPKDLKILVWDKKINGIDEALQKRTTLSTITRGEWLQLFNKTENF